MNTNIKLGRILGVPVGLHWSWFLIFAMVTWSLATGVFPGEFHASGPTVYWVIGAFTALLLFASVLAHEFGHAVVSIRNHIGVKRITLFIFGGVAQIEEEPRTPGAEFRIAAAGPLVSVMLGVLFGALYWFSQSIPMLSGPARWLAQVNLSLVLFNLIPGFPLDGGRIFRSIVWAINKDQYKATQIAANVGKGIALLFMVAGIFIIARGDFSNGFWLVFIGWFLHSAAGASLEQTRAQQSLKDVSANQVMDRRVSEVPANMTLDELVEGNIVQSGQRLFLVANDEQKLGLVTIKDIVDVPRSQWPVTPVSRVMTPWSQLIAVGPDTGLLNILQLMENARLTQVPVVYDNRMQGLITREQIMSYLRTRRELSA